jgi:hypothetical protein
MPRIPSITCYPSDEMITALKAYAEKRGITLSAALLDLAAQPLGVERPRKKHGGKRTKDGK